MKVQAALDTLGLQDWKWSTVGLDRVRGHPIGSRSGPARVGGCREKPLEKTCSTLAEVHLRAAVHDALATDRLGVTDEIPVFGAHPYKRSSGVAGGFPDSLVENQQCRTTRTTMPGSRRGSSAASWPETANIYSVRKGDRLPYPRIVLRGTVRRGFDP